MFVGTYGSIYGSMLNCRLDVIHMKRQGVFLPLVYLGLFYPSLQIVYSSGYVSVPQYSPFCLKVYESQGCVFKVETSLLFFCVPTLWSIYQHTQTRRPLKKQSVSQVFWKHIWVILWKKNCFKTNLFKPALGIVAKFFYTIKNNTDIALSCLLKRISSTRLWYNYIISAATI